MGGTQREVDTSDEIGSDLLYDKNPTIKNFEIYNSFNKKYFKS